jgi:hypothetical protein
MPGFYIFLQLYHKRHSWRKRLGRFLTSSKKLTIESKYLFLKKKIYIFIARLKHSSTQHYSQLNMAPSPWDWLLPIQSTAYLLIRHTVPSAVLSSGVSGPVTSTCHVHPAGLIPEEKCYVAMTRWQINIWYCWMMWLAQSLQYSLHWGP